MSRSRSAADATRFTPTGPYAHSKAPSFRGSTIPLTTPPANETPQQKVARLRRAANDAKLAQESGWDRVIVRGRVWADRAHRVTALSLVGLTVVAGTVALVGLGDMMLYNRRKRKEWFAEQQINYDKALALAYRAEAEGNLTPDLELILNKERAIEAYEEQQRNRPGIWERTKGTLFGGLAKEETKGGALGAPVRPPSRFSGDEVARVMASAAEPSTATAFAGEGTSSGQYNAAAEAAKMADVQPSTATSLPAPPRTVRGGMLDQLAENTVASLTAAPRQWSGWLTRSS